MQQWQNVVDCFVDTTDMQSELHCQMVHTWEPTQPNHSEKQLRLQNNFMTTATPFF